MTDEQASRIYNSKPAWTHAMVGYHDGLYLHERALQRAPDLAVEIGTASGVSTALLAHVTRVVTYDISERFFGDKSRMVGDAAREMLPPELLQRVEFRKGTAVDAGREHRDATFAFIDARHVHPWPCLDLLALLDCMKPGAEVVLHDINLPVKYPDLQGWGAKWLYDDLDIEKLADTRNAIPNIGSVIVEDKDAVREQLVKIVHSHEWEVDDIPQQLTAVLDTAVGS